MTVYVVHDYAIPNKPYELTYLIMVTRTFVHAHTLTCIHEHSYNADKSL